MRGVSYFKLTDAGYSCCDWFSVTDYSYIINNYDNSDSPIIGSYIIFKKYQADIENAPVWIRNNGPCNYKLGFKTLEHAFQFKLIIS